MSKAFTSEETDAAVARKPIVRAGPGEERPITSDGLRALVLKRDAAQVERMGLGPEAKEAREDLDHRIASLVATIDSVRVVETPADPDRATFGARVRVVWPDGRERTIRLVGPDEADGKDEVSVFSPLGRALLGARADAEVELERPSGALVLRVLGIGA